MSDLYKAAAIGIRGADDVIERMECIRSKAETERDSGISAERGVIMTIAIERLRAAEVEFRAACTCLAASYDGAWIKPEPDDA